VNVLNTVSTQSVASPFILCATLLPDSVADDSVPWAAGGDYLTSGVVSLKNDATEFVWCDLVLLHMVRAVSTRFVENYRFVEIEYNQPVNGAAAADGGVVPCTLYVDAVVLPRFGHAEGETGKLCWRCSRASPPIRPFCYLFAFPRRE
jgi:hypothetical protein